MAVEFFHTRRICTTTVLNMLWCLCICTVKRSRLRVLLDRTLVWTLSMEEGSHSKDNKKLTAQAVDGRVQRKPPGRINAFGQLICDNAAHILPLRAQQQPQCLTTCNSMPIPVRRAVEKHLCSRNTARSSADGQSYEGTRSTLLILGTAPRPVIV